MNKNYTFLFLLFFTGSLFAQTSNYYVQVGVFEKKVDINYFSKVGGDIHYSQDAFGFHRYYKGVYKTESAAKEQLNLCNKSGYNAFLVSGAEIGNTCRCNYIPKPQSILGSIKNIFFDFDRSNLRAASQKQLNDLVAILNDFPGYQVTLRAHTDSKGSNSYNDALSLRRADAAKRYLISRGITTSRISTETFGEVKPIAKNELSGGKDTEAGRQFNRRVEIIIKNSDGHVMNEIVDEIEVPSNLEQ